MYQLKPEAALWDPLPGVPWHDLSDEEYLEVGARYDAQFPDQPGSLLRWFEHVVDKAANRSVAAGSGVTPVIEKEV